MISNVVKTSTPQTNIKQGLISPAPMSTVQGQIKAPYSGLTTSTPANPAPKKTATTAPAAPTAQSYSNGVATPVAQAAPITSGNATTPSGAVVNAGTGGLVTPPSPVRGLVQPPSFGGIVGGLVDTSQRGSQTAQDLTQQLARVSQDTSAVDAANDELKKLRQGYATATGKIETTQGLPLEFVQGRSQVLGRQYASQEAAAQQALSNALTARGQSISGLQQAGGLAYQGQGLTQQGLSTAAGLVPEALRYDAFGGTGGSSLNPLNNADAIAQQVVSGQISPAQAFSMGGTIPNWQSFLNQKILAINPGFNVANAQGSFDARQSNVTTSGTTPVNTAASAYGQNYPAYLQTQAQLSNVEGLGGLLLNTTSGGQINPFDVSLANTTIANLKRNLSDADQARFDSTLAAFSGAASQLLANSSGQIPTDVSSNIAKIANGTLSLGALKAMVDQAKREGDIKLRTSATLVNTPGSTIGAPRVGGGGSNNPLGI